MFTAGQRDRARAHVLAPVAADERVVAGAVVGSFARGASDRWSDLDLTFALEDGVPAGEVLDDWATDLARALDAVQFFDLAAGSAVYRVFLLPGCLQLDVSFAPQSAFRSGPGFELLFGTALPPEPPPTPSARHLFGLAVHHAVRARVCIERGRGWQAEYWIAELRRTGSSSRAWRVA